MVLYLHSRDRASLDKREARLTSKKNLSQQYGNGQILHHDIQNLKTHDSNERFERSLKSNGCIEKDSKLTQSVMKDLSCSRCFDAPSPVMLSILFPNFLCRRGSVRKYQHSNHRLKAMTSCGGVLLLLMFYLVTSPSFPTVQCMSRQEIEDLREESKDMFYHAYNAYMDNAFPADELMPLTCQGRYRGQQPNRGDIDDALGNFSLTLIDSLDTLIIMGDVQEFERGVRLVIENVKFDYDITVSVFETNIRVVGGLISAHILSELVKAKKIKSTENYMKWYQGELLEMALDVGYRLLPSFNTSTGLPHPRVNLRHGIKSGKIKQIGETCTACAGTMILEFAALSRLSGEPIFEQKASAAMDMLWASRHRMSNLLGNVLNIQTGEWVRKDSGIGAGIDSYYEYVAKAYVLLGEDKYLSRWQTHYTAIMKYLGQGPIMQDVHMHRPHATSKPFVDALGAFFPGLQVLMGDVKPAIISHELLYQVMQRHQFIPEAFTADFQVHWGQHLLRPEFVESTYFLYRATGDPYYLEVGKKVLKSLQKHARVTCGYAAIKDVRYLPMHKEDRMDSFVLSETFKYLHLLFVDESDLLININDFVFTTEGHLLPLSLARLSNRTAVPLSDEQLFEEIHDDDVEYARSCPSTSYLFPHEEYEDETTIDGSQGVIKYAETLRQSLANVVHQKPPTCSSRKIIKRKLLAADFQSGNAEHMRILKDMGITMVSMADGRVQLLHTSVNAQTTQDAEEGLIFMQEMVELSKSQPPPIETPPKIVAFAHSSQKHRLFAGPAQFGRALADGFNVSGEVVLADPIRACKSVNNGNEFWGKIVLVERGDCMFVEKARYIESQGAKAGIVVDSNPKTTSAGNPLFAMSGDGTDDVSIPMVFLFSKDAEPLLEAITEEPGLEVTLKESHESTTEQEEGVESKNTADEDSEEDAFSYHFTSPVASFLEHSRRQVERYFSGESADEEASVNKQTSTPSTLTSTKIEGKVLTRLGQPEVLGDNNYKGDNPMEVSELIFVKKTDENGHSVVVGETVTTLKDPHGNIRKIATIETVDSDEVHGDRPKPSASSDSMDDNRAWVEKNASKEQKEQSQVEDNYMAAYQEVNSIDFSKLENFLHPKSGSVRRLIEDRVLKHPKVLSEMLEVNFSELVAVFQDLFRQNLDKMKTIEEVYVELFNLVDEEGSEGIKKYASSLKRDDSSLRNDIENDEDEILLASLASKTKIGHGDANDDDDDVSLKNILRKIILRAERHKLTNVLTDGMIEQILNKYVAQIEVNKDDVKAMKEKQDKIKVSTMMDLMSDEVIAQTLDEIKEYQKDVERTNTEVEKSEEDIVESDQEEPDHRRENL